MSSPHVLALPYPAQGHVIPLLELSQCLINHGVIVTFVNTDYNHKRFVNSLSEKNCIGDQIKMVSIPDGLEAGEDRNDLAKLTEAIFRSMPEKLEELIEKINRQEAEKISCVICDAGMVWVMEIAEKMKIRHSVFWAPAAATLALSYSIPKFLTDGIIDSDGTPIKRQMIQLAPTMAAISSENFVWACIGDSTSQKIIFHFTVECTESLKRAECLLSNSAYDLEPGAFGLIPELLPIGPLLASNRLGNSAGHFWPEDKSCLKWLDQQQPNSVIYVAFGSFTVLDKVQFQELALGLELCNKPFLWVVRPDFTNESNDPYQEGFQDRVATRGKMIGWSPQQKLLSHPSIACFLSHCGWNSTMEGVSNGVPFLCWPYFADQLMNESYICDIWKVGLRFDKDKNGIIPRQEIKNKLDQVLGDENFKARASELKEKALNSIRENGQSTKAFNNFVQWIKAETNTVSPP